MARRLPVGNVLALRLLVLAIWIDRTSMSSPMRDVRKSEESSVRKGKGSRAGG